MGVVPPHTPCSSPRSSAACRHACRTAQLLQMAFARSMSAAPGRLGNQISGSWPRQDARRRQVSTAKWHVGKAYRSFAPRRRRDASAAVQVLRPAVFAGRRRQRGVPARSPVVAAVHPSRAGAVLDADSELAGPERFAAVRTALRRDLLVSAAGLSKRHRTHVRTIPGRVDPRRHHRSGRRCLTTSSPATAVGG